MNSSFGKFLVGFLLASVVAVSALPTMAGRLKSYDGASGILLLELEDKSVRKFKLDKNTKIEWMGRNASAGALRAGSKISIQIAGALNDNPLVAGKIVDWSNSDKIIAQAAVAPSYTPVAEYMTTSGGGGVPDGAPKMNSTAHQDNAAIAHGGSQNQVRGPSSGQSTGTNTSAPSYPANGSVGTTHYTNQGASLTAPLEMMNIDPYSSGAGGQMGQMGNGMDYNPQMGMDYNAQMMGTNTSPGTLMGLDGDEDGQGMMGQEAAYGGGSQKITGQILESAIDRGYVVLQSYEHPNLIRVLLHQAGNAPMQLLVPGQTIEVYGTPSAQGFRATEIKAAQSGVGE